MNVWIPDDLARAAREAELNVSALCQEAIRSELRKRDRGRLADRLMAALEPALAANVSRTSLREALLAAINREWNFL